MARAIWTGSLSFGLVNIPVRLFNATSPKDVRFHQFEQGTGRRIRYRRVAAEPEAWEPPPSWGDVEPSPQGVMGPPRRAEAPRPVEIPYERIVKGFEIEPQRFVMVRPEELRELEPERTQTIEIEGFVELAEIDPVHFEKSYLVAPHRGVGAEKPYALLLEALRQAGRVGRVGVARFVLRTREYLAAIRPMEGVLGLETLFYSDEIRAAAEIENLPLDADVPGRELTMALQFIELLSMPWEPERYRDTYRERVLELLRERAEAEGTLTAPEPGLERTAAPAVPDLMAALRASVEAARERQAPASTPDAAEGSRPRRARRRTG
jgi:DNA end-binding protein Ku